MYLIQKNFIKKPKILAHKDTKKRFVSPQKVFFFHLFMVVLAEKAKFARLIIDSSGCALAILMHSKALHSAYTNFPSINFWWMNDRLNSSSPGTLRQSFTKEQLMLLLGEVIALALVVTLAARWFDFDGALQVVLGFTVAYLVPKFVYSNSKIACSWGKWLLLIFATLLAIYTIHTIDLCTRASDFSFEEPNLHADDSRYYSWALSNYDGRCGEPKLPFKGLPWIMLWLWRFFGVSIVWPLAMNYMFTLLAIVTTGKIAHRMLSHRFDSCDPASIAATAMLMTSLLCFLISQGVRIQKEAGCMLGIVMVGYSLAGLAQTTQAGKREKMRDFAVFVLGTVLLAIIRTNFAYFAMIGAAMMAFANKGARWKRGTVMAVTALAITLLFSILFSYSFGQQFRTVDGGDAMALAYKIKGLQTPYLSFIGDYYHYPKWERILLLPISGGVQYIIPFPWLYEQDHLSITQVLPRIRLMWYFVGGVSIYYFLFICTVHYKRSNLGVWAWWPLAIFLIIAYITGGSVSRYALPLQPLFVVIALFVLLHVKTGNYRRTFTIWMIVYSLVLVATLIFCYHTQTQYLNELHEFQKMNSNH